jgi:hypothetical protein
MALAPAHPQRGVHPFLPVLLPSCHFKRDRFRIFL